MMRKIVLILYLIINGWAGHFDEMFYANEPTNGYANPKYKEYSRPKPTYKEIEQQKRVEKKKTPLPIDVSTGHSYFNALAGLVTKSEYDVMGSNIAVQGVKTLPALIDGMPQLFGQADISVMLTPLSHTVYRVRDQQYVGLGAYLGYRFDIIDAVTRVKPRVGIAIQFPTANFVFAGGVALERDFGLNRDLTLLFDAVTVDGSYYMNLGVRIRLRN